MGEGRREGGSGERRKRLKREKGKARKEKRERELGKTIVKFSIDGD